MSYVVEMLVAKMFMAKTYEASREHLAYVTLSQRDNNSISELPETYGPWKCISHTHRNPVFFCHEICMVCGSMCISQVPGVSGWYNHGHCYTAVGGHCYIMSDLLYLLRNQQKDGWVALSACFLLGGLENQRRVILKIQFSLPHRREPLVPFQQGYNPAHWLCLRIWWSHSVQKNLCSC